MKKILIIAAFCLVGAAASFGQARELPGNTYPVWTMSNEVQKMHLRRTTVYTPSVIAAGNARAFTKGIASVQAKPKTSRAIRGEGTPPWVISKGVARMQYEKNR